ncbi:MAG: phosphoglucosamine mutase [Candidatus Aminicenantes bacterium]|nr:phosphoglucosamine mutase [Candidatus Aminicenantes bacterium]
MDKLFGTDGIRAVAGDFPLDPAACRTLGRALVRLLAERRPGRGVLVGRDTRESGAWIERALVAGIEDAGGAAALAGVIPTSAVSFLTRTLDFGAGIVISASHNPYRDNGIKVFSPQGLKIPGDWESALEAEILAGRGASSSPPGGPDPARPSDPGFGEEYIAFLRSRLSLPSRPSARIVVDCANGASSAFAPRVLRELGWEVDALHCAPDGRNINEGCGSLHPESLAARVRATGAAAGIAYDGDADRSVWVDETGAVLNGDHTLYILARRMKEAGRLRSGRVVATTMSNMGLEKALERSGIGLLRTRVGDKYVYEEMVRSGANLGGERSGHTILLDDGPTGDGILTSLRLLEVMAETGLPLSALRAGFEEYPQILVNVPVRAKLPLEGIPEVREAIRRAERALAAAGRLDVRYSGTESLARIMIEGPDEGLIERIARELAAVVTDRLG